MRYFVYKDRSCYNDLADETGKIYVSNLDSMKNLAFSAVFGTDFVLKKGDEVTTLPTPSIQIGATQSGHRYPRGEPVSAHVLEEFVRQYHLAVERQSQLRKERAEIK